MIFIKLLKKFFLLVLLFVFTFPGFLAGAIFVNHIQGKYLRQEMAWQARETIQCTEYLREGKVEEAINALDGLSSNQLFRSAYHKDVQDMAELPEDILEVWQRAKVYYDKYEIEGRHGMVSLVQNKLDNVPWSWVEANRRRFEAKYKGAVPQIAPELKVIKWFGPELSLEELRGKVVLLDFWGTRCKPCIAGMPKVQQLYEKYNNEGLVIIALTSPGDDDERITEFIDSNNYKINFAKASIDTIADYAISGIPAYFLIDKNGCLIWGPEHDVPSEGNIEELLKN